MSPGIFQDAFLRLEISGDPSHHHENKFLQYDTIIIPVLPGPNPQEDDAKFREFSSK